MHSSNAGRRPPGTLRVAALALAAGLVVASPVRSAEPAEGAPVTVRIRPLMLPVLSAHGTVEKYTQVEVTLELASSAVLGEVQVAAPRLQDAILTALYDAIESGWIIRGNIANGSALRAKLDDVSEAIVGKDMISRVLITPVARQSSWP